MVAPNRSYPFAGHELPAFGLARRARALAVYWPVAMLLALQFVVVTRAYAEDAADPLLPLPQLKAAVQPVAPQPAVTHPAEPKSSRRIPLSEPLPPVEPLPASTSQGQSMFERGVNLTLQSVQGFSNFHLTQTTTLTPEPAPQIRDEIPLPTIRPNEATVPGGLRPLSHITTDIAPPSGPMPGDRSGALVFSTVNPLNFSRTNDLVRYQWEAPVVAHGQLYFDDVPLEHFGQSRCRCLQPAISAAKFLGNVLILPYRMALDPPCRLTYNLRSYPRPGSPAPLVRETLPMRLFPLVVQAGVVTAIVLVIP
jgi:hypothetical protein